MTMIRGPSKSFDDPTDPEAPPLFSPETIKALEKEEKHGRYTLERLNPDTRAAIAILAANGFSARSIAQTVGVTQGVVATVLDADRVDIVDFAAKKTRRTRRLLIACLDQAEKKVGSAEFKDLVSMIRALWEMDTVESGRAMAIEEKHVRVDITAAWDEFVRSLETEDDAGRAKNTPPETHLAGGNNSPQLSGASNPDPVIETAAESVPDRKTDPRSEIQSEVPQYGHSASKRSRDQRGVDAQ